MSKPDAEGSNNENDTESNQQNMYDDSIPGRPAREWDGKKICQYASFAQAKEQAAFEEYYQPERDQPEHQRPTNKTLVKHTLDKMSQGKSDHAKCQQVGRPAEKGGREFIKVGKDRHLAEQRERAKQQ